jgi:cell fate (sporulation/competence/biofilm development) regulator YlbF (YheA/YmcA/DUF963 family)
MMNALVLPPSLQKAADRLADAMLDTKPMIDYQQVKARYQADAELQTLIKEYLAAQQDFRARQYSGNITQADLNHLRELQSQVQSNGLVMEFSLHQQAASFFLADVVAGLEQLIGIDFTALASAPCC